MKIRIMTTAVFAVLSTWAPSSSARETVALPYIFGVAPGDSVGQLTGLDTTAAGLLTVNNNININTSNDVGGGITSNTNNVASITFLGNSTVTGFTGTSAISFNNITAGVNATTVNFNGDVFTTQFNHSGTGIVNFNGNVSGTGAASSYIFGGDGFVNIGANKIFESAITTTAGNNTGTLTLNAGSSMIGAIGAGSAALKQVNVYGIDPAIIGAPATIGGAVDARGFNLISGKASITGAVAVTDFSLGSNTLTIGGAMTTNAGGTIATSFLSNSVYGKIVVNGSSNINAGGITVIPTVTGVLTATTTPFVIVQANASGTNGALVSVVNNSPRYTFSGGASSATGLTSNGSVSIYLAAITPLVTLVTTPTAQTVAPILDVNAPINTDLRVVQDAIAVLPTTAAIDNALAQLAPANTNLAAPWVAAQATQLIADTWMARLVEIQNLCCDTTCDGNNQKPLPTKTRECKTSEQQSNFWLKGIGKYGTQDNVNGFNGYKTDAVGVMLGYDVPVSDLTRVGVGAGYVRSNIDGNNSDNSTKIDSYHLTAYFNYAPDAFFVQGAVTAGVDKYEGSRSIVFPGISRQAQSDTTGQQYTATINAGKHFGLYETTITPLVGLQASHLYVDGYQEHGAGDVNLRVDSQNYDFLRSTVGVKVERIIQSSNSTYVPELHAKWMHDFNSTTMEQDAIFTGGGNKFNMQGIKQDRETYNVGAGLTLLSCNCDSTSWSVKALYDYKWNESHYDSHQVSIIAGMKF